MYLKIKDLTPEEAEILKKKFGDRAELIHSIYHEICKIEADCSLERILDEFDLNLTEEDLNKAIEEIGTKIANSCEDTAFQEMCDIADEIAARYIAVKHVAPKVIGNIKPEQ